MSKTIPLSVVIPTYQRKQVLLNTIEYLQKLDQRPAEIIVVDQTLKHERETEQQLNRLDENGIIRWIRLQRPSIPHAMNTGLLQAKHEIVLFLDDDIIPDENLIFAHFHAHFDNSADLVAGQVIQPWDIDAPRNRNIEISRFSLNNRQWINEFMGGNFSVKRSIALNIGGFDENFIHVAYCYEREFSERIISAGYKILFEPAASVHHLQLNEGGIRSYGNHLKTIKPSHAVGKYYFLIKSKYTHSKLFKLMWQPIRAIKSWHHLRHPWWIPATLIAEFTALFWAILLNSNGPRHINTNSD